LPPGFDVFSNRLPQPFFMVECAERVSQAVRAIRSVGGSPLVDESAERLRTRVPRTKAPRISRIDSAREQLGSCEPLLILNVSLG